MEEEREKKTGLERWLGKWQTLPAKEKKHLLRLTACLLLGLALMLWAGGKKEETVTATPQAIETETTAQSLTGDDLTQQLESLLCQVKGAGKVSVLLRYDGSDAAVYAYDTDVSENIEGGTVQGRDSSQSLSVVDDGAVLIRTAAPAVIGVLVVAEGAGDPLVQERLYQAVKAALGLNADQIAVIQGEGGEYDAFSKES